MKVEEAIELLQELTEATVKHYRSVNERTRFNPQKAQQAEEKAVSKVFRALTGETISTDDLNRVIG